MAMDNTLKVAAIPLDTAWCDRDENLFALQNAVRTLPKDIDVIVLPEMFNTGFLSDPTMLESLSDNSLSHPTLDAVRALAAKANAAICASWVWRADDGTYTNRCHFVEPNGETAIYDKKHLFALSSEGRVLTAGTRPAPVVRFRGWEITMAICYDIRFPEDMRNRPERYDLMLIPANWPDARSYAWRHLLIARAIENQAFVVGANRSGRDDFGTYTNSTYILNHLGMSVATPLAPTTGDDDAGNAILISTLSRTELAEARRGFPVLR